MDIGDDVNHPGWLASEKCLCCTLLMLPVAAFSTGVGVLILLLLRVVLMMQLMDGECMLVGSIWWAGLLVVSMVVFLLVMGVWVVSRGSSSLPRFMSDERKLLIG